MSLAASSLRTADVSPRSLPLKDVPRGRTSATQRQKFHTDDLDGKGSWKYSKLNRTYLFKNEFMREKGQFDHYFKRRSCNVILNN